MGLDQYLTAKEYVGGWEHTEEKERKRYDDVVRAIGRPDFKCEGSPHLYVEVSVAYWRKANQIHKWFVDNVQNGVDNCEHYDVSEENLKTLRALCQRVLDTIELKDGKVHIGTTYSKGTTKENFVDGKVVADPSFAIEALPTESGCFFGGTEYDEYYVEQLKDTVAQIGVALANFEGWGFQYHASW